MSGASDVERGSAVAFAAFAAAVHADPALASALRPVSERDALIALAVALGAARGFVFEAAAVRAALRAGEQRFLSIGAEVV